MSFNGINFSDASDIRIGQNKISALYFGSIKIWPRNPEDIYLVFTSEEDNNNFYFFARSSEWTLDIEVSYDDGKTWQTFTSSHETGTNLGTYIGTLDMGEKMCIRGLNNTYCGSTFDGERIVNENYYSMFRSDGNFKASGNIMGLIYGKYSDRYGDAFPENTSFNFASLFAHSKVTDISRLKFPTKTLSPFCYSSMFDSCGLIDLNTYMLNTTTLAPYCYYNMFHACPNLQEAPILPATTLVKGCYRYMFYGCNKINYIKMLATDISATDCLLGWVADVAPTGIFVKDFNLASIPINSTSGIPVGWVYEEVHVPNFYNTDLTIQSLSDNNTITYSGTEELLYRGINQEEFQVFDNANGVTLNTDEVIIFRAERGEWVDPIGGDNPNGTGILAGHFATTGNFRIFGNIASLNYDSTRTAFYRYVDGTEVGLFGNCTGLISARYLMMPYTLALPDAYHKMFYGCTNLVEAPRIEATIFGNSACNEMFSGCTSLTVIRQMQVDTTSPYSHTNMYYGCNSVKIIPNTILNDVQNNSYQDMFYGCSSLIDASRLQLSATTLADTCYREMFKGCSSLIAPPTLPATTLAPNCYRAMFSGCTNLPEAPILPATTLADHCYYYMFENCTSLSTVQSTLPATTLADHCCNNMFRGCTSLAAAPALPATTLAASCYRSMFNGCTGLTTAPQELPATTLAASCYNYMFYRCTSLTTAPELPATTLTDSCYSYMFEGCTSLTTAPQELPATTLTDSCYMSMFSGTKITKAPELPATTLSGSCYRNMFYGCTSLATAPALPATTLQSRCYQHMFYGCTSLTAAPELPATTLVTWCYAYMFQACTNLRYIKCLATNISALNSHAYWVQNVALNGTFVKPKSMTSWTRGTSGIPTGWTVVNAS